VNLSIRTFSCTCLALAILLAPAAAANRTWTAADGRTVVADFVSATEESVTIRTKNGRKFTLKLDQISATDREFVKQQLEKPKAQDDSGSGKYDDKATGRWEKGEHDGLDYRFYGSKKLRRSKSEKYPLVIYLHGRGGKVMGREEFPDHLSKTFSDDKNYRKRPCFILVPQAKEGIMWNGVQGETVIDLVKDLIKELPVDKDRVYLTGYSMGGYGTWWALAREPKLFAAGVPIAGGGNPSTVDAMRKIPIWAFHGAKDKVVPVSQTQKMVEALEKRGDVKYTEFPDKGHDVWDVYQDDEVHEWLFEQKKK
jgi:predicted peptidase